MRKLHLSLALAALCLLMVACNDDDPVKPEEFAVVIQVTDLAGDPVEGLRVGLVNDHAFFQDGGRAAKALVRIPFRTALEIRARWTIEDIEGTVIKVMSDSDLMIGTHRMTWDGKNQAGVHQPSGRYMAHLLGINPYTGQWVFEDRVDMLLSMLDSSRVPAGFTDKDGKLVLKDRKLFPHLYDRPDMTVTNENGEPLGLFNLTPLMRISLADTSGGGHMDFKMDVPGATTLDLVWDPQLAVSDGSPDPEERIFPGVALIDTTPPTLFKLGPAYPNPFN